MELRDRVRRRGECYANPPSTTLNLTRTGLDRLVELRSLNSNPALNHMMRRNGVKRGPDGGGDQVVKEQEEPCGCDCDGGAGDSTAIKLTGISMSI